MPLSNRSIRKSLEKIPPRRDSYEMAGLDHNTDEEPFYIREYDPSGP
jgi:hypothetical protein